MQDETNRLARREEYDAYLLSPAWQAKRQAALHRAGHRCQLCNRAANLDVHHRTYERFKNELPEDLTVLCRGCHEHFHLGRKPQSHSRRTSREKQPGTKILKENWDAVVEVVSSLEPGRLCSTKTIAARAGREPGQIAASLIRLSKQGRLVRVSKRQWKVPVDVAKEVDRLEKASPDFGRVRYFHVKPLAAEARHPVAAKDARHIKTGVISAEEIEAARTPDGGWTRETLAEWGIDWPPPKGWKKHLENRILERLDRRAA